MKYCKNGSKSVSRETFILMNEGWKKKPWNLKKNLNNDEFLTFTASNNGCKNGKYCMALEKKQ